MTSSPALRALLPLAILGVTALAACEGPTVDGVTYACTENAECGSGFECVGGICQKTGTATDTAQGDATSSDASDATSEDVTATDATNDDATTTDATTTDATTTDTLGCRGTWDDPHTPEVETQNVDESCSTGRPGVCNEGQVVCENDTLVCREKVTESEELCNGEDDDCDGETDEDFSIGTLCDGPDANLCENGVVECVPGDVHSTRCSEDPGLASPELCNGFDDDCDGDEDEDFGPFGTVRAHDLRYAADEGKYLGQSCGTGACAGGVISCISEFLVGCPTESSALPETCNGADDDCDGDTDEGFDVGAGCDGPDADSCAGGLIVCDPTAPGGTRCDESGALASEVCDGLDNDCDAAVDEDFKAGGTVSLSGASYAADNGKHLGDACGVGVCAGGTVACNAQNRARLVCQSATVASAEICDGLDNDCDGLTDEDFGAGGSVRLANSPNSADDGKYKGQSCGAGACAGGTVVCAGPTSLGCSSTTVINTETCNGQDDDCDGATDDGFAVGAGCDGPDPDSCATGHLVCDPTDASKTTCQETAGAAVEICDGQDNDCDGKIDEDFKAGADATTSLSGALYAADNGKHLGDACGAGYCSGGVVACNPSDRSKLVCQTTNTPSPEQCDAVDNDCDGPTDEDFGAGGSVVYDGGGYAADAGKYKGQTCGIGPCAGGVVVCKSGQALTCSTLGLASTDTCNGSDDDCDGATDEDYGASGAVKYSGGPYPADAGKYKGQSCGAGLCSGGAVVCSANAQSLTCNTLNKIATETCNSLDDNCNGGTDDGITRSWYPDCDADSFYSGTAYPVTGCATPGTANCPPGLSGPWTLSKPGPALADCDDTLKNVNPVAIERCNGRDDDCEGTTDQNALLWVDCDGDGFFKETTTASCTSSCTSRTAIPTNGVDCDDVRIDVHPGAAEVCVNMATLDMDGVDDDCNTFKDDGCPTIHRQGVGGTTWGPGDHLVVGSMYIDNVHIQAGATVYMMAGTSLNSNPSTGFAQPFFIEGTGSSPVIIKGDDRWTTRVTPSRGSYGGIATTFAATGSIISGLVMVEPSYGIGMNYGSNITLDNVTISGCTSRGIEANYTDNLQMNAVTVEGCDDNGITLRGVGFTLTRSGISGNGGGGVIADESSRIMRSSTGQRQVAFDEVTVADNAGLAISLPLPDWTSMNNVTVKNNGIDVIRGGPSSTQTDGDAHWRNFGVPYQLGLSYLATYNSSLNLTIDGGTVIEMRPGPNQGAQLLFGMGDTVLTIADAATRGPVVIRLARDATLYPNSQLEVWFATKFDFQLSTVDGLTVEDGMINVTADGGTPAKTVVFRNVTVSGADYAGIQVAANGLRGIDFENVVASSNAGDGLYFGGVCPGCGPMKLKNSIFSNNGNYGIWCANGCGQYTSQWTNVTAKDNVKGSWPQ